MPQLEEIRVLKLVDVFERILTNLQEARGFKTKSEFEVSKAQDGTNTVLTIRAGGLRKACRNYTRPLFVQLR